MLPVGAELLGEKLDRFTTQSPLSLVGAGRFEPSFEQTVVDLGRFRNRGAWVELPAPTLGYWRSRKATIASGNWWETACARHSTDDRDRPRWVIAIGAIASMISVLASSRGLGLRGHAARPVHSRVVG